MVMRPFEIAAGSDDMPQRLLNARGELDIASADALLAAVHAAVAQPGATGLRLDLSGITFIDSVGIGVLIKISQIATEMGGSLDMPGPSATVQQVLRLTGLAEMFGLAPELGGEVAGS